MTRPIQYVDQSNDARKRAHRAAAASVDNHPAIERLASVYIDLCNEGWREIMYAPKDDTEIEVIECGSTGIHRARWRSFNHQPLNSCGCLFIAEAGDLWPSHPILWRPIKPTPPHSNSEARHE